MTMPQAPGAQEDPGLPPPEMRRMITSPFFPEQGPAPIVWQVDQPHPLKSNARVVRMFIVDGGVEVYTIETIDGGHRGMRNFVPTHFLRLTEELMHPDVLQEEIDRAERAELQAMNDEGDVEDDEDDVEEEESPEAPTPPNGQPVP